MRGLFPLGWRSLAARPVRTALTVLGIALGVAVLASAIATSEGIDGAISRTVTAVAGRADLSITAFDESGLSEGSVAAVSALPGVRVAAPSIQRRTYLVPALTAAPGEQAPVAVLGVDPVLDPKVRDLEVVRGSGLVRPDEPSALISETLAAATGLDVGSPLDLYGAADAPPAAGHFRVVGILRGDGPVVGASGRVVVIPIAQAQALFSMPGVSGIDLVLQPDADPAAVTAGLRSAVQEPYVLSTPADLAASLRASTEDFRATMALIAAVALFVGAFLIFNTLSMTVSERVREVGLIRAAGATRRQIGWMVLAQAILLGIVGSALGLALGLLLAAFVSGFVGGAFGLRTVLQLSLTGWLTVIGVGLLVTVSAALEPAARATRIPPIEALRARGEPGIEGRARLRWLIVVAVVVGLVGILLWPRGPMDPGLVRPLSVYGLMLAATLLVPFVLRPLARLAGLPFALTARVEERLARGALRRDRSRTALTVGALVVGIGLVVAVSTVAIDARRTATAWLAGVIPGDELITAITPVAIDESGPIPELAAVAGVERVSPLASFGVAYRGLRLDAAAVNGSDLAADGRLTFVAGDRAAALAAIDAGGSVILPKAQADRLGLGLGSTMTLAGPGGPGASLRVVGIVEHGLPGKGGEAIIVGWSDATSRFGVTGADALAVRFDPSAGSSVRTAVDEVARRLGLQPVPLAQVQGAVTDALDRVFGLFDALAIVAVVVAALGIVNTLWMDVAERVREIGILRAAGMTRRQVGRMVVVQAGIIGTVGAVLGIVTGLVAATVMLALTNGTLAPPDLAPQPLILAVVLGLGLAMLAAYYPARVAGRLPIVRAVRLE